LSTGLASFGPPFPCSSKILNGANRLTCQFAAKFQMGINLQTAKPLGVKISNNLLSLGDCMICVGPACPQAIKFAGRQVGGYYAVYQRGRKIWP
jgi:hypothetical protein